MESLISQRLSAYISFTNADMKKSNAHLQLLDQCPITLWTKCQSINLVRVVCIYSFFLALSCY